VVVSNSLSLSHHSTILDYLPTLTLAFQNSFNATWYTYCPNFITKIRPWLSVLPC